MSVCLEQYSTCIPCTRLITTAYLILVVEFQKCRQILTSITTSKRQHTHKVPVMAEGSGQALTVFYRMDVLLLKSESHTRCTLWMCLKSSPSIQLQLALCCIVTIVGNTNVQCSFQCGHFMTEDIRLKTYIMQFCFMFCYSCCALWSGRV